jgi:hypothetical protein
MVLANRKHLSSLIGIAAAGVLIANHAQATCETPEELGAIPLEVVEPSGNNDGTFAVYWKTELPYKPKADLAPALGSEFDIVRCLPPGKWVFVGAGAVLNITGSLGEGLARPIATTPNSRPGSATEFEKQSANLYWRPMGGDIVLPKTYRIVSRERITHKETLGFESLFVRERGNSFTIELSESGKKALAVVVNKLRGASGRLGIEVFSHRSGNREDLREDTQVRANIIARHISQSFGLSENAIVAIGLGSLGLAADVREAQPWPAPADVTDGVIIRIVPE